MIGWPTHCYVIEFLGNNRALFECKAAGHQFKTTMFPKSPTGAVPSDDLLIKFARYWGKKHGRGVTMQCPKCRRAQKRS